MARSEVSEEDESPVGLIYHLYRVWRVSDNHETTPKRSILTVVPGYLTHALPHTYLKVRHQGLHHKSALRRHSPRALLSRRRSIHYLLLDLHPTHRLRAHSPPTIRSHKLRMSRTRILLTI